MQKLKRFASLLLCLIMVLSLVDARAVVAAGAGFGAGSGTGDLTRDILTEADSLFSGANSSSMIDAWAVGPKDASSSTVKAGETLVYSLYYRVTAPPTWSRDYDKPRTLFDLYENNRITVELPEGMSIVGAEQGHSYTQNGNVYTFDLADLLPASAQFYFDIDIYVEGNGTEDAIRSFDLSDCVTFHTEFTVLNKLDNVEVATYTQEKTADMDPVTTVSPDVWGTRKSVSSASVDRSSMTATVVYTVEVGLMNGDTMLTSSADYIRVGRDAFARTAAGDPAITLTDTLSAVLSSCGSLSGTALNLNTAAGVTIGKTGSGSTAAMPVGTPIVLSDLNTVMVDADGDGMREQAVGAYTSYTVTAVYDITEDMIQDFENPTGKIDFSNTAALDYQLANKAAASDSDQADTQVALPVKGAVAFNVKKNLTDYADRTAAYDGRYGSIEFVITRDDGQPVTVYTKNSSDQFVPQTAASVSVSTGQTYYLLPGIAYSVAENLTAAQAEKMQQNEGASTRWQHVTPAEGGSWTATFVNVEKAGTVTVVKTDDNGRALQGAKFTLTNTATNEAVEKTTDNYGKITFDQVYYGSYTLVESFVPDGFAGAAAESFTVGDTKKDFSFDIVNRQTFASLLLTKYVGVAEVPSALNRADTSFPGTFTLERKIAGGTWETVSTDIYGAAIRTTVDRSGQIAASVPAYDDSNNEYTYRFVEAIPTGWYDPADKDATVAYSDEVTLTKDGKANPETVNVSMENRRFFKLSVGKQFWSINGTSTSMVQDTTKTVAVTLYTYDGTSMTAVDTQTAGAGSSAVFENLAAYDGDTRINYYVAEADVAGYKLDAAQSGGSAVTLDGKTYLPVAVSTLAEVTKTLYNIEQLVPVIIYKKNSYTQDFVTGSGVTVSCSGSTVYDGRSGDELTDKMILTGAGLVVYLQPGQSYQIVETVNETGLHQDNATEASPLVVNLTGTPALTYSLRNSVPVKSVTVLNSPDPAVKISKRDARTTTTSASSNATGTALKTAEFAFYTKNTEGKYAPVLDGDGHILTLKANTTSTFRLPTGTYYLVETNVPQGYLDPDKLASLYTAYSSANFTVGQTTSGETHTFIKAAVTNGTGGSGADNLCTVTVDNIPNTASLKVTKYIDGVKATSTAFPVVVTANGETVKTGSTGTTSSTQGTVTFTNLPVYDENGDKIVYKVLEGDLGALASTYVKVSDGQEVTLSISTAAKIPVQTAQARIDNATFYEIEAMKYLRHSWEFHNTGMQYTMGGATFGLYEKDETTGDWNLVSSMTTDGSGAISFRNLNRAKEYAVVEQSCTNSKYSPYKNGTEKEYAGNAAVIPAADLDNYSYLIAPADQTRSIVDLGEFINQDHWVQFNITKWQDRQTDPAEPGYHVLDMNPNSETYDRKADGIVFVMYRREMAPGETTAYFNPAAYESQGWTKMGGYVSGTVYNDDGTRAPGELMSDADQNASKNVVYILTEVNDGPGSAEALPESKYTFYYEQTQAYQLTLEGTAADYTPRSHSYRLDTVNQDDILNGTHHGSGSQYFTSSIRISKWQDGFDDDGLPKELYTPLVNVVFGVYSDAACTNKLEELTCGLDSSRNGLSIAQGSPYYLFLLDKTDTIGTLSFYTDESEDAETLEVTVDTLAETNDYYIRGVKVYLREESAPNGFGFENSPLVMYLTFVIYKDGDTSSEGFSDAYYVTNTDTTIPISDNQFGTAWSATWNDPASTDSDTPAYLHHNGNQYRVVNYPMVDTKVRVHKYGYTPDTTTAGKTADILDTMDIPSRQPLAGVSLVLLKYDETATPKAYKYYNYKTKQFCSTAADATFVTRADGSYLFAAGLPIGDYRIVESSLGSYANTYEKAYSSTSAYYRQFHVGSSAMNVSLYDPILPSLEIKKTDAKTGAPVQGVTFTLTIGGTPHTAATDASGIAAFDLVSGTYKLTEAVNGKQLSINYLKKYMESTGDAELIALVDTGVRLGYTYSLTEDGAGGKDVVVSRIFRNDASADVTVQDPELVSFTLSKTDEESGAPLSGATFRVYYKAFDAWTGTTAADTSQLGSWTDLGSFTTKSNGQIAFTDREPGIYVFKETAAPAGYDLIKDATGSDILYTLIVTGGMTQTVTGPAQSVQVNTPNGSTKTVTTCFKDAAAITVANRPKTPVVVTKLIEAGDVPNPEELSWSVRVDLYESATATTAIGSASITNATVGSVKFLKSGSEVKLSQGKTYYIKETVLSAPAADYRLTDVCLGTQHLTATSGGRYPITVSGVDTVELRLTNTLMRGTVTFRKSDAVILTKLLPGAAFTVVGSDGVTPVAGASVSEVLDSTGSGTGIYTASIPLTSADPTDYYIVETNAPTGYILQAGIKLKATLSPEHNYYDWRNVPNNENDKFLVNRAGWTLSIQKYVNLHSAMEGMTEEEQARFKANEGDAFFTLYAYDTDTDEWVIMIGGGSTDSNGVATWLLTPGETYAVCESSFNTAKFIGPDGWYNAAGQNITSSLETITVNGAEKQVYVLRNVSDNLSFSVYNKPWLTVKIVKEDVGNYPANVVPLSTVKIFELTQALPTDKEAALAVIAQLLAEGTPVKTLTTAQTDTTVTSTSVLWNTCDPTKNYVIVETNVADKNGKTYNTINKEDSRVIWYVPVNATAEPDPSAEPAVCTLKNVHGDATVKIAKNAYDQEAYTPGTTNTVLKKVDSLLKGSRDIVYSIKPTVTSHNQPLTSFIVKENGLSFTPAGSVTDYAITKIVIGAASQSANQYFEAGSVSDNTIQAVVTWYDKAGLSLGESKVTSLAAAKEVAAPTGAATFTIRYFNAGVEALTDDYSLGCGFTCGETLVYMTVKQQEDWDGVTPIKVITKFTNNSALEMSYLKWNAAGTQKDEIKSTPTAASSINVDPIKLPILMVSKTSAEVAQTGLDFEFVITVTNASTTEPLVNPVVLDMLPAGFTFTGEYTVSGGSVDAPFTNANTAVSRFSGEPTMTYADASGDVVVGDKESGVVFAMTGTLQPRDTVTITLKTHVGSSAILYGSKADNYVYASSSAHGYHVEGNEHGYSFTDDKGNFPSDLAAAAAALSTTAAKREGSLHDALGDYTGDDYVWVKSSRQVSVLYQASMTLRKAIRGDQDTAFNDADDFLATASRTNSSPSAETTGYVDYRLTVSNGMNETQRFIVLGDAISKADDALSSAWGTDMNRITSVAQSGTLLTENTHYFVYYYCGDESDPLDAPGAVRDALIVANDWTHSQAWPQLSTLPTGWQKAADVTDKTAVTAFLIVFDSSVEMKTGDTIVVTYNTTVDDITDDTDFAQVAFENANNVCYLNYLGNRDIMESNLVSAVVMDGRVAVAGDVWIDEDQDGTQGTVNRRDYSDYKIIQKLIAALSSSISIVDNREYDGSTKKMTIGADRTDTVGESILHYSMDDLGAALAQRSNLYVLQDPSDPTSYILNAKALKTTDPYNYYLTASLDSSLAGIFKLTAPGARAYFSANPTSGGTEADALTDADRFDSNFFANGSMLQTKPFYLMYSDNVDETKDIGFIMLRDLEIVKVAKDDPSVKVAGAKFTLSGPFDEDEAAAGGSVLKFTAVTGADGKTSYALDPNGTVTELTTDADGTIRITGLNWWKEYVVTETAAAAGYELAGAAAAATTGSGTVISPLSGSANSWVLKLPAVDRENNQESMTVSNERKATAELAITKNITDESLSGKTLPAEAFSFELADSTDTVLQTKKNAADGSVSFNALTFTAEGTYIYTIREVIPADDKKLEGFTYAADPVKVRIDVAWNETSSKLEATVTYLDKDGNTLTAPAITNPYIPDPVSAEIKVKKQFKDLVPDVEKDFTFTLEAVTEGAPMPADASVTVTGAAEDSFGSIKFEKAGVYEYKVSENAKPASGYDAYTFDEKSYTVKVTVTGTNGVLSAAVTVDDEPGDTVTFTNEYKPDDTSVVLSVKKTFKAGDVRPNDWKQTFKFRLTAFSTGAPMPAGAQDGVAEVEITDAGVKSFDAIVFDSEGTYEYMLQEVIPEDALKALGYTYDDTVYYITISVTDIDGELSANTDFNGEELIFENGYDNKSVEAVLPVQKLLEGNTPPSDVDFTFDLTAVTTGAPMPTQTSVTVSGANKGYFDAITFTEAGTYVYQVTEKDGHVPGYVYNTDPVTVTFTVTDNKGQLAVSWKVGDTTKTTVEITNRYTPESGALAIPVTKTVSGPAPSDKTFSFTLQAVGTAPMPEGAQDGKLSMSITGNATKSFPAITFTAAGTFEYLVSEDAGSLPGYSYSNKQFKVTVTVVDNAADLSVSYTIKEVTENAAAEKIEFVNTYLPTPTQVPLSVEKLITNLALNNTLPKDNAKTFTFTLAAVTAGAPLPEKTVVTTLGEAKAAFGTMHYDKVGTYEYTVTETDKTGDASYKGYTFDKTAYTVKVEVLDDKDDGKLRSIMTIGGNTVIEDATDGGTVIVTNLYKPLSAELALPVKKIVTGNERQAALKKTFEFILAGSTAGAPMPAVNKLTLTDTEEGLFGAIKFTEAGEWSYTVKETNSGAKGYTYDKTVYTVNVKAEDVDGQLVLTWSATDGSSAASTDPMTFTNRYDPDDAEVVLHVVKTITGDARSADGKKTFRFELKAVTEGAPMPSSSVIAITDAGAADFGKLVFTKTGTYEYTLREIIPADADKALGYDYDDTVYSVIITVTDTDGELSAETKIAGEKTTEAEFINDYDSQPVEIELPVKKLLSGNATPADKAFTFVLTAKSGEPMPASGKERVTVTGAGEGKFGLIRFDVAGTYYYTVAEEPGTDHGYAYDKATHTFAVTVVDKDGQLEAHWTVDGDEDAVDAAAEFTNVYIPDGTFVILPVEKRLTGADTPSDKTFRFSLKAVTAGAPLPEDAVDGESLVTIIGAGESAFGAIAYTAVGIYKYSVEEIPGSEIGYTYDPTKYTVTVTVTDTEGALSAKYVVESGKPAAPAGEGTVPEPEKLVFANDYLQIPVELVIPVRKEIDGPTPDGNDKLFSFTLKAVTADAPMPADGDSITILGRDKASFGAIVFTAPGTYEYELAEEEGSDAGYTYDPEIRRIKAVVTDNDGTLEVTWTVDDETADEVVFVNPYKPEEVSVKLRATKVLKNLPLKADMFTFTLKDAEGTVLQSVTNTADGEILFDEIAFEAVGEYVYTISEEAGSLDRVTYDQTEFTVTVAVKDNDGVLEAEVIAPQDPVFVNVYTPEIPKTGYGPDMSGLLRLLSGVSLATLITVLRKKKKEDGEEE